MKNRENIIREETYIPMSVERYSENSIKNQPNVIKDYQLNRNDFIMNEGQYYYFHNMGSIKGSIKSRIELLLR